MDLRERRKKARQRCVCLVRAKTTLPAEDLPQAHQSLHSSGSVGAQQVILDAIDRVGSVQKLQDGLVLDGRSIVKELVLGTVYVILLREPLHRGRLERFGAQTIEIAHRHEDLERLVLDGF